MGVGKLTVYITDILVQSFIMAPDFDIHYIYRIELRNITPKGMPKK